MNATATLGRMAEAINSYWDVIEPVWDEINIYDGEATFLKSIQPISRPLVLLYAAHFCQSEVCNGGFLQFFKNSTGVLCPEAIEGFKLIGMPLLASVIETAAAPLGSTYPRDRKARWGAMLDASGLEKKIIEEMFQKAPNEFLAYREATKSLGWDDIDRQFYQLVRNERGGFEPAADSYARSFARIENN
jgi:hypothetical protein